MPCCKGGTEQSSMCREQRTPKLSTALAFFMGFLLFWVCFEDLVWRLQLRIHCANLLLLKPPLARTSEDMIQSPWREVLNVIAFSFWMNDSTGDWKHVRLEFMLLIDSVAAASAGFICFLCDMFLCIIDWNVCANQLAFAQYYHMDWGWASN